MSAVRGYEKLEHIYQQPQQLLKILEEGIDLYGCHEALYCLRASASKSGAERVKEILQVYLTDGSLHEPWEVDLEHAVVCIMAPGRLESKADARVLREQGFEICKTIECDGCAIRELQAREEEDEQDDNLNAVSSLQAADYNSSKITASEVEDLVAGGRG